MPLVEMCLSRNLLATSILFSSKKVWRAFLPFRSRPKIIFLQIFLSSLSTGSWDGGSPPAPSIRKSSTCLY